MPTARVYHAAAAVGDRWYVAGGLFEDGHGEEFPTEVDVYDPAAGHWAVLGQLAQPGEYLVGIADPRGHDVLFSGRMLPGEGGFAGLPTCDIASPDGVHGAPDLLEGRYLHASALAAGRFIVSGGWSTGDLLGDAEIWDGAAARWMSIGSMPGGPKEGHTMTTLKDGHRVLVAGGSTSEQALTEVDVLDASCGTWSSTTPLRGARSRHKALLLLDGRVLVAGGLTTKVLNSAEIFDPSNNTWTVVQPMSDARFDFDMVLLPDGRALAAGGSNNGPDGELGALNSVEVYDPAANMWTTLSPMHDRRRWPTMAVLSDGVYVAGGDYSDSAPPAGVTTLASVERLAWSDLGIAGPIELDAGVLVEYAADAAASCGVRDAGADGGNRSDGAIGTLRTGDAGADASPRDASSSHRGAAGTNGGCSCTLSADPTEPLVDVTIAWVVGFVLHRRSPRPGATSIGRAGPRR